MTTFNLKTTDIHPDPIDVTARLLPPELTRAHLARAYRQTGGNITQAAKLLGIHKATLYRRMKVLGVTRDDLAGPSDPAPPEP